MLIQTPVQFERQNNAHWPLPPDYAELTTDGQRLARINACLPQTEDPKDAVHAWRFFCNHYLFPDADEHFNPMFYDQPLPHGFIHLSFVHDWEANKRTAHACPRGSGKTTTGVSYIVWKLATHSQFTVAVYKSKESFIPRDAYLIKSQLEENSRIRDDFGTFRPRGRSAIWSNHMFCTVNKCWFLGFSFEGRVRGPRYQFGWMDDIEYDPKNPKPLPEEELHRISRVITQVILPSGDRGHTAWTGTTPGTKSLLYRVVATDAQIAERNPQYADHLWHKVNIPTTWTTLDGVERNAWSAKFTPAFQAEYKELLGASYGAEYGGQPISPEDLLFQLQPEAHEYHVSGDPFEIVQNPWSFDGEISYHEASGAQSLTLTPVTRNWRSWLDSLYRFVTVDYAYTQRVGSDWNIIHVLGADSRNNLFSLDMWKGKMPFGAFIGTIWQYAIRWKVSLVGIEAYPVQEEYYQQFAAFGEQMRQTYGTCPSMFPIRPPPGMDKGAKIARLQWRFAKAKIKLPFDRKQVSPYADLYTQIERFTLDLANLPFDDEIDTLGMSADILRGRSASSGGAPSSSPTAADNDPLALLQQGEIYYPGTDIPLIMGLNPLRIPDTITEKMHAEARRRAYDSLLDSTDDDETEADLF